jgi:hypothetical protein
MAVVAAIIGATFRIRPANSSHETDDAFVEIGVERKWRAISRKLHAG